MFFRTDIAAELLERCGEKLPQGIERGEEAVGSVKISRISVTTEGAARALGKAEGEYVTIEVKPFSDDVTAAEDEINAMAKEIARLVGGGVGLALVVGLGNRQITPDALGPCVAEGIIATRHIRGEVSRAAGLHHLRPVAVIAPGVLGQTGMETGEIIAALVRDIKPDCVLVVDALASRSLERLGCTVQLANTGISPGSGVANARAELSQKTLGVPVVSIGVPTVVDGTTLAAELLSGDEDIEELRERFEPRGASMMVTPREIDLVIQRASRAVAMAINRALQPSMSIEDIMYLSS